MCRYSGHGFAAIREPAAAEELLDDEVVDFVGMGRPWHGPEWEQKGAGRQKASSRSASVV